MAFFQKMLYFTEFQKKMVCWMKISHVLEWDIFRYHAMQSELQTLATKYYTESLENLRQVVFSMEGEKSET